MKMAIRMPADIRNLMESSLDLGCNERQEVQNKKIGSTVRIGGYWCLFFEAELKILRQVHVLCILCRKYLQTSVHMNTPQS